MRYFFSVVVLCLVFSCKTKPHTSVKLKSEKISSDCSKASADFKMNSNINGERYEFQDCLDGNFDGKNYSVVVKNDTLVIDLPRAGQTKSLFSITLDVDVYPMYKFITIGNDTYGIGKSKN